MTNKQSHHERLGITFAELGALYGTLGMLRAEVLEFIENPADDPTPGTHVFDMDTTCKSNGECGTVACIGGTMALIMGKNLRDASAYVHDARSLSLGKLFYPTRDGWNGYYGDITPEHAIQAIHNFLMGRGPQWCIVMDGDGA